MSGILEGVAEPKVLIFPESLHPGRLTWNLQITHLERKMIFQTSMILFHVNLPGCNLCIWPCRLCWKNQKSRVESSPKKILWARRRWFVYPNMSFNVRWVFSDVCQSLGDRTVIYIWYLSIKIEYVQLAGGFKHFFCVYPYLGKWSTLADIFQMVEATNWSTSTRFWWMFHFPMKFIHGFRTYSVFSPLWPNNWRQVVGGNFFCADIMARRCVEVRFFGIGVTHLHLWGIHSSTQTIDVWYIYVHLVDVGKYTHAWILRGTISNENPHIFFQKQH